MGEGANRFISCYNLTDAILRDFTGVKPQQSFSEALRLAAAQNAVVKRFEDDLFAYARLRNAIVHSANGGTIIAEPHMDVVVHFEEILALLKKPPLAVEILGDRSVVSVKANAPLSDAVLLITKHHYSNIPIVSAGKILGLLIPKDIVTAIGVALASGQDLNNWLDAAKVSDIPRSAKYTILSRDANVPEVADCFEEPKLKAVILTADGTLDGRVIDIITPADLPRLLPGKNS